MNCELPYVQASFRKGRGTRDQIANIRWIIEKARELKKKSTSVLLTMPKPLTVWITKNCGKSFKRWMTQRDGTGREVGGGFRMGNTCIPVVDSC